MIISYFLFTFAKSSMILLFFKCITKVIVKSNTKISITTFCYPDNYNKYATKVLWNLEFTKTEST